MVEGKLMRIDKELVKQIEDFAKKNQMSMRQASRELARLNMAKFNNKKIMKEIKF